MIYIRRLKSLAYLWLIKTEKLFMKALVVKQIVQVALCEFERNDIPDRTESCLYTFFKLTTFQPFRMLLCKF